MMTPDEIPSRPISRVCWWCRSRFFLETEIEQRYKNRWFCSYCLPNMFECSGCREPMYVRNVFSSRRICRECRDANRIPEKRRQLTNRFEILRRDGFTCRYCGRSPMLDSSVKLHIDHIKAKAHGGRDFMDNLVTACEECNLGKKDVILDEREQRKVRERSICGSGMSEVPDDVYEETSTPKVLYSDVSATPLDGDAPEGE